LTYQERTSRYVSEKISPNVKEEAAKTLLHDVQGFLGYSAENPMPISERYSEATSQVALMMQQEEEKNSVTVQKYFTTVETMIEASAALMNKKDTATAFRLFREMRKVWGEIHFVKTIEEKFHKAAKNAIQRNPRDANALFVFVVYESCKPSCDSAELESMAKTCVSVDPEVPEYHHLLGLVQRVVGKYNDSLMSFDRALELEHVPDWLYDRATSVRHFELDERKVIKVGTN
jgi:hypothetical protein